MSERENGEKGGSPGGTEKEGGGAVRRASAGRARCSFCRVVVRVCMFSFLVGSAASPFARPRKTPRSDEGGCVPVSAYYRRLCPLSLSPVPPPPPPPPLTTLSAGRNVRANAHPEKKRGGGDSARARASIGIYNTARQVHRRPSGITRAHARRTNCRV